MHTTGFPESEVDDSAGYPAYEAGSIGEVDEPSEDYGRAVADV